MAGIKKNTAVRKTMEEDPEFKKDKNKDYQKLLVLCCLAFFHTK